MFELRHPTGFLGADLVRLAAACVLSLLLHAALLASSLLRLPAPPPHEALQATLLPEPLPPPVSLIAPDAPPAEMTPAAEPQPKPERKAEPKPPAASHDARRFTATEAARMAMRQIAQQPYYPEEAIARGLQGQAVVRLFLDESGNAIAARLESSSGHAILDEAAVRAARAVRSLPAGAPGEVLLPVRFRLR
jgi:protein TonB